MYKIIKIIEAEDKIIYRCEVVIQDGKERWDELDKEKAIFSVIKAARVLNGTYIGKEDIEFVETQYQPVHMTIDQRKILEDIRRGEKILLDHTDMRVKMRITDEECRMILAWREGEARFTFN